MLNLLVPSWTRMIQFVWLIQMTTFGVGQMLAAHAATAEPAWCAALTQTQDPNGQINVRSGPGTNYAIVAESPNRVKFWVEQNSAVEDASTGLIWFEGYATSSSGSGFSGWIQSDFLDLTACNSALEQS